MHLRYCANCVSVSTRPRITFDKRGFCNACVWMEEKKTLDWASRIKELEALLNRHKSKSKGFDCIVPVSGGKDGSYVAHTLRHRFKMNPLTVTVIPPLSLEIGDANLRSFIESGYDNVSVSPNPLVMKKLNRFGFEQLGFPYYGWLIAIHTAVARVASSMNIDLIFYGEDGEVEYGGVTSTARAPIYGTQYQKEIYLEGGLDAALNGSGLSENDKYWFSYPENGSDNSLELTHWSYFENWDPYRNYLTAKEHCGLVEASNSNAGTFTNFAQNDQALYSLHAYLMYLKFGFGRATQDACIEVRRGAMTREQAVNLVKLYDGHYPLEFEVQYLEYFGMSLEKFKSTLLRHTNLALFEMKDGNPIPKFRIE